MHPVRLFLACALPIALCACAPRFEAEISVDMVLEVRRSGESALAAATLLIPRANMEDCAETISLLTEGLRVFTPVGEDPVCVDLEGEVSAEFKLEVPVVADGSVPPNHLVYFTVDLVQSDPESGTRIGFGMTHPVQAVFAEMNANAGVEGGEGDGGASEEVGTPIITFKLANDSASALQLTPLSVYLDGAPALPGSGWPQQFNAGASVDLRLSDVVSDHIALGNSAPFAILSPAPPQ